jgi:hypothetical protein
MTSTQLVPKERPGMNSGTAHAVQSQAGVLPTPVLGAVQSVSLPVLLVRPRQLTGPLAVARADTVYPPYRLLLSQYPTRRLAAAGKRTCSICAIMGYEQYGMSKQSLVLSSNSEGGAVCSSNN